MRSTRRSSAMPGGRGRDVAGSQLRRHRGPRRRSTGEPVGSIRASSSKSYATTVAWTRSRSALLRARRNHPRTVPSGTSSLSAIGRCPSPRAWANNAAPMTSTTSRRLGQALPAPHGPLTVMLRGADVCGWRRNAISAWNGLHPEQILAGNEVIHQPSSDLQAMTLDSGGLVVADRRSRFHQRVDAGEDAHAPVDRLLVPADLVEIERIEILQTTQKLGCPEVVVIRNGEAFAARVGQCVNIHPQVLTLDDRGLVADWRAVPRSTCRCDRERLSGPCPTPRTCGPGRRARVVKTPQ